VLFGNTLSANMFMLGIAYQKGGLPVSAEAIELNGQAVTANIHAFRWGRRAAHLPDEVRALIASAEQQKPLETPSLDDLIARRADFLTQYQDAAYAGRYLAWVERIRRAENAVAPGATAITEAVARSLFKLMAIKDEYEVARLYTDGSFLRQLPVNARYSIFNDNHVPSLDTGWKLTQTDIHRRPVIFFTNSKFPFDPINNIFHQKRPPLLRGKRSVGGICFPFYNSFYINPHFIAGSRSADPNRKRRPCRPLIDGVLAFVMKSCLICRACQTCNH